MGMSRTYNNQNSFEKENSWKACTPDSRNYHKATAIHTEAWIIVEHPETDPHRYKCGQLIFQQSAKVQRMILKNSSRIFVYPYWRWETVTLASFTKLTQNGLKPKYLNTFWNKTLEKFFLTLGYLEISYNIVEYKL